MLNNIWKVPIGDWSGDGHRECDWFIIKSNFTVEEAREIYFKAVEESGIDISNEIAFEYEDNTISDKMVELLPEFVKYLHNKKLIQKCEDYYEVYYSKDMLYIVLEFMKKYTPEFEYEIIIDSTPILHFYGLDDKNRNIGQFGYGLFSL